MLGLILTFGLFMHIVMEIIWEKVDRHFSPWLHLTANSIIRLLLTLLLALSVFLNPNATNYMELFGSIYFPLLGKLTFNI